MIETAQGCCTNVVDNSTNTLRGEGESPTPLTSLNSAHRVEGRALSPSKVVTPRSKAHRYYLDYTANLDGFEALYLYQERTKACDPKYLVQECKCPGGTYSGKGKNARYILPSVCMSANCVNCEPWVNRRRAFSIFKRFVPFEGCNIKPVIYTVFTVPKHVRDRYTNPKAWQKVRTKTWHILKKDFGGLFGVECSHPKGDSSEEFHPHLNFLWRVRKGCSAYINVKALREAWAKLLGVRTVNLKSRYYDQPGQIMQKCKYVSRVFPGYHYWTGPVRWYGKYPRKGKPDLIVCENCGSPFKVIGFIHRFDVDDWYEFGWQSGSDPPWYNDKKIQNFKRKSKCNAIATPC